MAWPISFDPGDTNKRPRLAPGGDREARVWTFSSFKFPGILRPLPVAFSGESSSGSGPGKIHPRL